jgi:hypothetical protein
VVGIVGVLIGLLVWLRSYTPLDGTRGGAVMPGAAVLTVEPAFGSDGREVAFPPQRTGGYRAGFDLTNTGRFAIRLDGLAPVDKYYYGPIAPRKLALLRHENAYIDDFVPFHPVTIAPGEQRFLSILFHIDCSGRWGTGSQTSMSTIRLRYTYEHLFHRSQDVQMPLAITLQCRGKIRQ